MPFKSDFFKNLGRRIPVASDFLPKIKQHVTDNIIYYDEGFFAFAFKLTGFNFEGVDTNLLYSKYRIFNNALMTFGKNFADKGRLSAVVRRRRTHFDPHPLILKISSLISSRLNILIALTRTTAFQTIFILFVSLKKIILN